MPVLAMSEPDEQERSPEQLDGYFARALFRRLERQKEAGKYDTYLKRYRDSGFHRIVVLRLGQSEEQDSHSSFDVLLEDLLDFFLIRFCGDINRIDLPEEILKYQGLDRKDIDFREMILDYLQLEELGEIYYVDFLRMPLEKLKAAGKSFLFPEPDEKILLIADQSLTGNCRFGFAFTEKALYWRAHMQKPRMSAYSDLRTITPQEDWININGHFFNGGTTLNRRMSMLLRRIQLLEERK